MVDIRDSIKFAFSTDFTIKKKMKLDYAELEHRRIKGLGKKSLEIIHNEMRIKKVGAFIRLNPIKLSKKLGKSVKTIKNCKI